MMNPYIDFIEIPSNLKTQIWMIESHRGNILGEIRWYSPWRQYTFVPRGNTVWNVDCLNEIKSFIKEQMDKRKAKV